MSGYKTGIDRKQIGMYSLEDMVGDKSMVRVIDRFIDIQNLETLGFTKARPSPTGRPGYPPCALCKLYVYGYENGIRSSRKLERETCRNIEVMWLMDSLKPDYKTISEFRRENLRPLQKLFREFVKLCKSWDLIGGELIAVDGSKFKANNNKKSNFSRKKINSRIAMIDERINSYLTEMDATDKSETNAEASTSEIMAKLEELQGRKSQYEEYLQQLDESGANELSTADPDARLMGNNRGGVEVAYNVQSAVDAKYDIVVAHDVSTNPADHHQLGNMIKKVKRVLRVRRFTALADKGYYNGKDLLRAKKSKVNTIITRQKPSKSAGRAKEFYSENFIYDKLTDSYTCPHGYILSTSSSKSAKRRKYVNKSACKDCLHKDDCIKGRANFRTISRSEYSEIYEETDKRFAENKELYKRRQEIVEHPFGTVKHSMNGGHFLLRTRRKVRTEVALLFLGYNLKRALSVLGFDEMMARLNASFSFFYSLYVLRMLPMASNLNFFLTLQKYTWVL